MTVRFLGTAAAEGIPALFCRCANCKKSAELGGKNIRTRSGALLNERILIDISPDLYQHKLRYGLDLSGLTHIFVTHSHTDHFDGAELTKRSCPSYCHVNGTEPLHVYGNEKVCRLGRESLTLEFSREEDDSLKFHVLEPYKTVTVEGIEFTPLPAVHDSAESCFIYLIRQKNATFLYGNDTAVPTKEVFDFLSGTRLDLISLDCTFGEKKHNCPTHMGLAENETFLTELKKRGCLKPETQVYATHFSHNCGMTHTELKKAAAKYGLLAAWDGMTVKIG